MTRMDLRMRMLTLAQLLYGGGKITSRYIVDTFGVSKPTACRDLMVLEQVLPVIVTLNEEGPFTPMPQKVLQLMATR